MTATATPTAQPLGYRLQTNVVPLPYRCVSVQPYDGAMTDAAIHTHLMGREAYRRTDFIVLRGDPDRYAVAAIRRASDEDFFSTITDVEVVALPDTCTWVSSPETDCANRSALAEVATAHGVGKEGTCIVEGLYDHVNLIHRPDPLRLRVVEVAPPEPPKLYNLVRHVLSYADLPPILVELERIEVKDLAATVAPEAYLVPCRSGGLEALGAPVHFLDERPPERLNWTLIGCERSLQFHHHYYGDEPPRVEMCPRQLVGECDGLTMLKCCLLEFHTEREGNLAVVPWGTDLTMVESALRELVEEQSDV